MAVKTIGWKCIFSDTPMASVFKALLEQRNEQRGDVPVPVCKLVYTPFV